MIYPLLIFLAVICCSVSFSYIVGRCLLVLAKYNTAGNGIWTTVFQAISLGLFAIIAITAAVVAKGVTIFLPCAALILLFSYKKKPAAEKQPAMPNGKELKALLAVIACALVYLLINLISLNYFDKHVLSMPVSDSYFYTSQAGKMFRYGIEGVNFHSQLLQQPNWYRIPYHYFDMWFLGILENTASTPYNFAYSYIYNPLCSTLILFSLISFINYFKQKINIIDFVICAILSFAIVPKLAGICVVASLALSAFYTKKINIAILCLSIMPFINILSAPVVCTSIFLLGVYFLLRKAKKDAIFCLCISVCILVFTVLYYYLAGNTSLGTEEHYSLLNAKFWAKVLNHLVKYTQKDFFYFIPVALLFIANYKNNLIVFKKYMLESSFVIISIILGIFFTSVFELFNIEGFQIRDFPGRVFFLFLTAAGVYSCFKGGQLRGKFYLPVIVPVCIIAATLLYNVKIVSYVKFSAKAGNDDGGSQSATTSSRQMFVDASYVDSLNAIIKTGDKIGYLYSDSTLKANRFSYNPFLLFSGLNSLGFLKTRAEAICLNTVLTGENLRAKTSYAYSTIKNGEFKRFVDANINQGLTLEQYEYAFIKQKGLKFLLIEDKCTLPSVLDSMASRTITDSISGQKLVVLKN